MKINLIIAPFRDSYFYHNYGCAVRDLQFIETLASLDAVDRITLINRPVSVLERVLLKKPFARSVNLPKVHVYDITSRDFFGALKGRSWAEDVYKKVIEHHLLTGKLSSHTNVFLDFLPIGTFSAKNLEGWIYWYDFIDNFKKHNRFTEIEKFLVNKKYTFVKKNADFITAVSDLCLESNGPYNASKSMVVTNKIFHSISSSHEHLNFVERKPQTYHFGFIGFVTDKLDIEFIKLLAEKYKVAIFGTIMDKKVGKKLTALLNVDVFGKFKYKDVQDICAKFQVGLLPYLSEKSHDGSPLKLYEYMKYNVPCLTSMDYEIQDRRFIRNYNKTTDLKSDIDDMIRISGSGLISDAIKPEWKLENSMIKAVTEIAIISK
jgi:hypothetical protein